MKSALEKSALVALIATAMTLFCAGPALAHWEMDVSSYIGLLSYPTEIGGMYCANDAELCGGVRFAFGGDALSLEIDVLTGLMPVDYDPWYDDDPYDTDLPVIFTLDLVISPIKEGFIRPYVRAGLGGAIVRLELSDPWYAGEYVFWTGDVGAGIKFVLGRHAYLFMEYTDYLFLGDEYFTPFDVKAFAIGYGMAF